MSVRTFFFFRRVLKHSVDGSSFCFSFILSVLRSVQTAFLGEFANCEKKKKDFSFSYLSARPYLSVLKEQLGSLWTHFLKNCYFNIFQKSVENIQVLLKSDKNNRPLTGGPVLFIIMSYCILLRMRNISDKTCRINKNTNFVYYKFFPIMR